MRSSEACAQQRNDIDWENGLINVEHSLVYYYHPEDTEKTHRLEMHKTKQMQALDRYLYLMTLQML